MGTKRRYNYLSHLVDSGTDSVVRIAKISAFWATLTTAVFTVNLAVLYIQNGVSVSVITMLYGAMWTVIFSLLMYTQLSWVLYVVYHAEEEWDEDTTPPSPAQVDVWRVYESQGTRQKLVSSVIDGSGAGGKVARKGDD